MQRIKFIISIPTLIDYIHSFFKKAGKPLFLVGGSVRDSLMEVEPKDFDLATNATPEEIKEILKDAHLNTDLVGEHFGVILVKPKKDNPKYIWTLDSVEIATFRTDVGEGRRPESVKFTTIEEDVKRRDLTINALFYDLDTLEIVDLVDGIKDITNKVIRTVGKAEDRFREDPLRKLRAIRFMARTGFNLSDDLIQSLKNDNSLDGVSPERIHDEFLRTIISAKNPIKTVDILKKFNFFDHILPGLNISNNLIFTNDFIIQVAHLVAFDNLDKGTQKILDVLHKMKYSTDEIRNILFLVQLSKFNESDIFKFKKTQSIINLKNSQILKYVGFVKLDLNLINAALKFQLTVKGTDERLKGFEPRLIGKKINELEIENFKSFKNI